MSDKYLGEDQRPSLVTRVEIAVGDGAVETSPAGKALVEQPDTWRQLPDLTEGHQSIGASPAEAHRYRAQVGKTGETAILTHIVSLVGSTEHGGGTVGFLRLTDNILKTCLQEQQAIHI